MIFSEISAHYDGSGSFCRKCDFYTEYYSIIDVDGRVLTNINYISSSNLSEFSNLFLFCCRCSERVGLSIDRGEICSRWKKVYQETSVEIFSVENIRHLIQPQKSARKLIRYLSKHSTTIPRVILKQYRQVSGLPAEYEKFLMYKYFSECNRDVCAHYWPEEILCIILNYYYE